MAEPIKDSVWINAAPDRVFKALVDGDELGHWWPKSAESEPRAGGKLVLTWMSGHKLETSFTDFVPGRRVEYPFYTERLEFNLTAKNGGTSVEICHHCGPDASIHVAQCWGFLKANLKSWVEFQRDLR